MVTTVCLHAWVLLIFSSLLNDYDIVTASSIAAALDFPSGLIASFLVHQLGRRPTIFLAQVGSGTSALICAVLAGKYTVIKTKLLLVEIRGAPSAKETVATT